MSQEISNLLNDAQSTYRQQLNETKKYVTKWEKTGLLEGIEKDYEKHNTAILLENQARELVTENSKIGSAGSEEWNGVALPLVRRIFGEIFAKEFVSVQPMNLPSGLVFYLDFKYGTNRGKQTLGTDVMGDTSSSSTPTGGLYRSATDGKGAKSGYTLGKEVKAFKLADGSGTAFGTGVTPAISDNTTISIATSNLTNADTDLAGAFFLQSGSGAILTDNAVVNGSNIDFTAATNIAVSSSINVVYYEIFNDATNGAALRGDFEDTNGGNPDKGDANDLDIPEMNVQLRQEALVAKTRKLKVVWSPEFAQDLNAYHSIDAEAELTSMLSEYISMEIDMEILAMLDKAALHTGETFVLSGSAEGYVSAALANGTARYDFGTWVQTLGYQMQKVSNQIHKSTMRGGANFAVMSPEIAAIIEAMPGFGVDTDGTANQFAAGVTKVGQFANRYTIYKNPYRTTADGILMGFRGNQFLETGAVYAPYIPLIMTPLVYDPTNFTPRKGVMTRYAKKVVRKEFFGKIAVTIH
tara:strand:+ start:12099 stop:13673 length:1575 start_codon:yes stop_codon:yes gene_type:complete